MTKEQAAQAFEKHAAQVQSAFPSLFTKEDVIKVLRALQDDLDFEDEEDEVGVFTQEQLDEVREDICNAVENRLDRLSSDDVVDLDSAEFEVNGDRLSVVNVDINTSTLIDEVSDAIEKVFNGMKVKETTES